MTENKQVRPRPQEVSVENRDADILRAAKALAPMVRAKYIKDKIGPDAPFFIEALIHANASDMSDSALRQLLTFLTYGDPDGTNAFPSHQTVAAIRGSSVATSERATNELTKLGWISTQRTRRGPAYRTVKIPSENMTAIEGEVLEPSPVRVLNGSEVLEKSPATLQNANSSKFLDPHPCGPRTLTREGLPTTVTYEDADHQHRDGSCLRGEGGKAEKQLGATAQPQAATYRSARRRRGEVRPW